MKRYYLFVHPGDMRLGGMDDCRGVFDTAEEAIEFLEQEGTRFPSDEVVIWDVKKNRKVRSN